MAKKIAIEKLAGEVSEILDEYADTTAEGVKKAVRKTSKAVKEEIKAGAPVKTGDYQKSWSVKKIKENSNSLVVTVHSKNRYQLAHLLEHGHVLQRNVEAVLTGTDGISLDEIDTRLEELQKELLNVANAKGNYDSIVDEIYRLREAKQNAQVEGAEREGMKQRISEMQQFLAEQTQDITEYDEQLVRRLIEKITVYDEKVIVEFKSGTSVDIHR